MARIVVENLDPLVVEKLKILSQRHGRPLNEELKAILEQATIAEVADNGWVRDEATWKLEQARARYADQIFGDSTELVREDRDR